MISPNQTIEEALSKLKTHFCTNMLVYVQNDCYFSLGKAIHPIQDAFSPGHDFNIWTGNNYLPHIFEGVMNYTYQANNAAKATLWIYEEVNKSENTMNIERLGIIFDTWQRMFERGLF